MKYYFTLLALLIATSQLNAQEIVKMAAVKANDYGITYSLPKTKMKVDASYTKTTRKAGDLHQYAERYLNINNAISKDETIYRLDKVVSGTLPIIDREKTYLVEFKSNSTASFLSLTKDGLLCAINAEYEMQKQEIKEVAVASQPTKVRDPYSYLSEEILRAGSTYKQAELIAKQIYRLRENRNNILTGEADNMPPDGESYKLIMAQLEEQEKALTTLFTGTEQTETGSRAFEIVPDQKDITDRILFRFSSKLGVVGADDLAGAPVSFSLVNLQPQTPKELNPKEVKEMEAKFSKGIIYNIPSKAKYTVHYNAKIIEQKEFEVVQYGSQEVLAPKMFDSKQSVRVIFNPDLGSIKEMK